MDFVCLINRLLSKFGIIITALDYGSRVFPTSERPAPATSLFYALDAPAEDAIAKTTLSRTSEYVINALNAGKPEFEGIFQKAWGILKAMTDKSAYATLANQLIPSFINNVSSNL